MNLFFVPHAGSSAMSYMAFRLVVDKSIKICPLEVAGRGKRMGEECFEDARKCAKDLFEKNREKFEEDDYAIFAHSMGTILTHEMVKLIEENGIRMPKHIFFSGRKVPFLDVDSMMDTSNITDENLIDFMKECGDVPEMLLQNKEIMRMSLDILKHDIIMADKYKENKENCNSKTDISVLYGLDDTLSSSNMEEWKNYTSGKCDIHKFSGGHFYYREHKKEVGNIINKALEPYL